MATDVVHRRLLLLVLLLGGAIRGYYLYEMSSTPEFTSPTVDAEFHDYWAKGLAHDEWSVESDIRPPNLKKNAYLRPPGYPFFLATIYKICGHGPMAPRLIQMLIGLVNILLAYRIALQCLNKRTAIITATLMASYWIFIYYEGQLLEPSLLILCILSGTYCLLRWTISGSALTIALSGFFIGIAALTRPNALSLLFAAAVWIVVVHRKWLPSRRRWLSAGGVIAAGMLTIAPATVRNYVVTGKFTLISANGGVNFYIGNNENAQGFFLGYVPQVGEFGTCFDYPKLVARLEKQLEQKLTYAQVDQHFAKNALEYIIKHPVQTLRLTLKKAALFWSPHELSHNKVVHYERDFSPLLRSLPGHFALVVTLAAAGLWFNRSHFRSIVAGDHVSHADSTFPMATGVTLLSLMPVAYFVSFLPFFNAALYRVPILPFMLIFSAGAIDQTWKIVRTHNKRKMVKLFTACVVAYLVARTPFVQYEPNLAKWHFGRGVCYHRNGDFESAINHYEQALFLEHNYFHALEALARASMEIGRLQVSIKQWQKAIELRPENPQLWTNLGSALLQVNEIQPAIDHFKRAINVGSTSIAPHMNLASVYIRTGNPTAAIDALQQGIKMNPLSSQLHAALGMAMSQTGKIAEGIRHLEQAIEIAPDYVDARLNLGLLLTEIGQYEKAIEHYQSITSEQPQFAFALHNLGVAYEALSLIEQATDAYSRAIDIDENMTLSHYKLGLLLQQRGQNQRANQHLIKACDGGLGHAPACRALMQLNSHEN